MIRRERDSIEIEDETPLWHATRRSFLGSIASSGLSSPSYWTMDGAVADYYLQDIEDGGNEGVLLRTTLGDLRRAAEAAGASLQPDSPGISEPITTALGVSEDEVWQEWGGSDRSWEASMRIIGSLRVPAPVCASVLMTMDGDELVPIGDLLDGEGPRPSP